METHYFTFGQTHMANVPMDIVTRAREYLALNAAESGADVLIEELAEEIERLRKRVKDVEETMADKRRLTRELDVALNGDGAAKQASLCDIVSQVKDGRWRLVRE